MSIIDLGDGGRSANGDGTATVVTYETVNPPETQRAALLCEGVCAGIAHHTWARNRQVWHGRTLRSSYKEFACEGCGRIRTWGIE